MQKRIADVNIVCMAPHKAGGVGRVEMSPVALKHRRHAGEGDGVFFCAGGSRT